MTTMKETMTNFSRSFKNANDREIYNVYIIKLASSDLSSPCPSICLILEDFFLLENSLVTESQLVISYQFQDI